MATDPASRALLPEGLRDDLPPWAEYEAALVDRLMARAAAHGYERVAPPLVEFEESMAAFAAPNQLKAMFRVLDPVSQKMMAVRADMTAQIARIASSRLAHAARPLRLSYAGHVLRVKGSQLRPARQFRQAGVELIGPDSIAADLEVIALAAEALAVIGIGGLSVDLVSPTFVPTLAAALGCSKADSDRISEALDCKDIGALQSLGAPARTLFTALLEAAGDGASARDRLQALDLPPEASRIRDRLLALSDRLADRCPDLAVTIDPGESRGFEFQTGVGFAFFARNHATELGRGGRYRISHGDDGQESAVGFSMYLDSLLQAVPPPTAAQRLYVPFGADALEAARMRDFGWRTVDGLDPAIDPFAEAKALGCGHIFRNGAPLALDDENGERL